MKKQPLILIVFILIASISGPFALAQESLSEAQYNEKAKKRLYPGGRDEEDLKVMDAVPEPLVKYYKSTVQSDVLRSMTSSSSENNKNN